MINFRMFDVIGEVTPNMDHAFSEFIENIMNNCAPYIPIVISINSSGGHTSSGISIYNKIRMIDNPVYVIITGDCRSIATVIALSVPYENRYAFDNTSFFIHTVSSRNLESVTVHQLKKFISVGERENNSICEIIKHGTKIPKEELNSIFTKDGEMEILPKDYETYNIAQKFQKLSDIF